MSTPVLSQEPRLQMLSPAPVPAHGHLQEQQRGTLALYQNPHYHHEELEDMAQDFLIQDVTSCSAGMPVQESLLHAVAEPEEELDIYDYIYAKQEDEDDNEAHSHDSDLLSSSSTHAANGNTRTITLNAAANPLHYTIRQSPVSDVSSPPFSNHSPPSSPYSALSPCSPTLSSLHQGNQDVADILLIKKEESYTQDSLAMSETHVKQEAVDSAPLLVSSGYMDTPMDLYGSAHSPVHQEAFPMTMEEKLGYVEFLFDSQSQAQVPTQMSSSVQGQGHSKPVPHFMSEAISRSCVNLGLGEMGSSSHGSVSERLGTQADDNLGSYSVSHPPAAQPAYSNLSPLGVTMEASEPEGGLPFSPTSCPVTPVQGSPALHPTTPGQLPRPSKSTMKKHKKAASLGTELNFHSSTEPYRKRARTAEPDDESTPRVGASGTITIRPAPSKRRKANRGRVYRKPSESPRLGSLPSPPTSVRTTPPLPPSFLDTIGSVDVLDLPPPCIPKNSIGTNVAAQPITPTSPLPSEGSQKLRRLSESSGAAMEVELPAISHSSTPLSSGPSAKSAKKNSPPNATNKRPWTPGEEHRLLELVEQLTPIKEIAEKLNRSVHSVRSRRQVLTDPGFVKGNGHAQPRRSKPDPSYKLPTYSQMAFLSLARLPELQGTLNDVASMVEKLFSRYLNRIPRTGHKNLQIWRAQISDALAHEKGHPRPRFESFGMKRGRQWVYRLTDFGKGVMKEMGGVEHICDDLLKNNERAGAYYGPDGESLGVGGAEAGLGQGNGYGYSYCHEVTIKTESSDSVSLDRRSSMSMGSSFEPREESTADDMAASNAIAKAMAAMAAGLAAMTAVEDQKLAALGGAANSSGSMKSTSRAGPSHGSSKGKHGSTPGHAKTGTSTSGTTRSGRKSKA